LLSHPLRELEMGIHFLPKEIDNYFSLKLKDARRNQIPSKTKDSISRWRDTVLD